MYTCVTKSENSRKGWIDLIKVIAAFMVLFQHSISHIWTSTSPESILWKSSHFLFVLSRIAVLLFFMCSGVTMLQKQRSLCSVCKSIFSLLKVYICWMLIYGAVSCVSLYQEGLATIRTSVNAIAKAVLFGQYHTWFIFTLIGLYLITPFLFDIVSDKLLAKYFLVLSIVFTIFVPMFGSMGMLERFTNTLNSFNLTFVFGYVMYYVLGFYISNIEWKKQYTLISFVGFVIGFGTSCVVTMLQSFKEGSATQEILGDFSILTFITVISFFGIFRGLEKIECGTVLKKIVGIGFGIYLMHPLFLEYIKNITDFRIFVAIPLFYVFCIFICLLISKSKVLSKLLLK